MKRRMKPNADKRETGYHSHEHDEDPTCHKTHEGDTPCEPVESDTPNAHADGSAVADTVRRDVGREKI
jgi:hypothetical protein